MGGIGVLLALMFQKNDAVSEPVLPPRPLAAQEQTQQQCKIEVQGTVFDRWIELTLTVETYERPNVLAVPASSAVVVVLNHEQEARVTYTEINRRDYAVTTQLKIAKTARLTHLQLEYFLLEPVIFSWDLLLDK